jgi:hypothetical protein
VTKQTKQNIWQVGLLLSIPAAFAGFSLLCWAMFNYLMQASFTAALAVTTWGYVYWRVITPRRCDQCSILRKPSCAACGRLKEKPIRWSDLFYWSDLLGFPLIVIFLTFEFAFLFLAFSGAVS